MDDGHDAELDKDKVVKNNPEQAAEESPSLGMHAQGVHVVDMGGTSGDENWLGSVGSSIDSPAAAAAALINEENHDLPCADAGDAHAVDLTPEESPSPLPPGVWTDNPGSGTSISLPQLDGRASRDSTPRMCTGGAIRLQTDKGACLRSPVCMHTQARAKHSASMWKLVPLCTYSCMTASTSHSIIQAFHM